MSVNVETYAYLDSADLFSNVASQPWAVFLDSGVITPKQQDKAQQSKTKQKQAKTKQVTCDVLAISPRVRLVTNGNVTRISEVSTDDTENDENVIISENDPLSLIQQYLPATTQLNHSGSPYLPGAIGYFSYDLARRFEVLPSIAINDERLPEMAIGIYDVLVVVDHLKEHTLLVYNEAEALNPVVNQWRSLIDTQVTAEPSVHECKVVTPLQAETVDENMDRLSYQNRFKQVRDYTIEGDCYQVNLAKRFTADVSDLGDEKVADASWQTYADLRIASPAPYGAYLNMPFAQILSNSPESFIQCTDRQVSSHPIKGTKARDHSDADNDKKIAQQLLNSGKDRSENLMIVDLMRNDLSRCCELGSVTVPSLFSLHSFANVHHLISTVSGVLREELHVLDLLRSCFPGGSITGAPKVRAMQIIEELEPHRRGLYCGSIGYIGMDGHLQTNIAIRTIVVKDGVARYSAGGGLVIESDVDQEYQEIIDKAKMMQQVILSN